MNRTSLVAITTLVLTLFSCFSFAQPEKVDGDWHGVINTPTGGLTIVLTIEDHGDGELSASLESVDQAPGVKFPLSSISLEGDTLTWSSSQIGASYTGVWNEDKQQWVGTFKQGASLPLSLMPGLPDPNPIVDGLDGRWEGTIDRNGVPLRLIINIHTTEDQGTLATLDSPDQAANGIPVSDLKHEDDTVSFTIKLAQAQYIGTLTGGTTITGTWTAPGLDEQEIIFTRNDKPKEEARRPQTPKAPFPYTSEEVAIPNPDASDVTLAGTLLIPEGQGPFPAAVLITGSGPQDRDESLMGHKPFLVLADALARQGIAVLRYDDRGVGESSGEFSDATSADFATDAYAVLNFLRTHDAINHEAIGYIGHSEGGVVAPIAATFEHTPAFIVMLAGPGTPLSELLIEQNRLMSKATGGLDEDFAKAKPIIEELYAAVIAADSEQDAIAKGTAILNDEAMETIGIDEPQRTAMLGQICNDWMRALLAYDPAPNLQQLDMPLLALNGSLDLQVPADANLDAIRQATSNNPDVTIINRDGLNHLFQHATIGTVGEYAQIEETFDPETLRIIADWINERFTSP